MGTITKALEMLSFFSRATPELGLADFVRQTGRDKTTVHRHLVELTDNGFLEQDERTRAYRLGPAILRLAAVREATAPLRRVVLPLIQKISEDTGELVHFAVLQGTMLSHVCHVKPGGHSVQVNFDEGEALPMHATASGRAVLAFGPPALRERVLANPLPRFTDETETDPERLKQILADTARRGVARSDQAFDGEVASRAAPVFGPQGDVFGAVAVATPVLRMTPDMARQIEDRLANGLVQLTDALGGTVPPRFPAAAHAASSPTDRSL